MFGAKTGAKSAEWLCAIQENIQKVKRDPKKRRPIAIVPASVKAKMRWENCELP